MSDKNRNQRNIGIIAFVVCLPVLFIFAAIVNYFAVAFGAPQYIIGTVSFWVGVIVVGWVTLTNKRII